LRGQGHSVHVLYLRNKLLFWHFKHILLQVSCKCISDNGHSAAFSKSQGHLKYAHFMRKKFLFDHIAFKLTTGLLITDKVHSRSFKGQGHSEHAPSIKKKNLFQQYFKYNWSLGLRSLKVIWKGQGQSEHVL
jgi:hypothetical protein